MVAFQKRPPMTDGSKPLFTLWDLTKLIIPLLIQQVLAVAVGAIDTMMVAYAGEAVVSGVSLVNSVDMVLLLFFTSLVTGGSVVVSQLLGQKKQEDARAAAKQLIYVATFMATLVTAFVLLFGKPLLSLLFGDVEADVMSHAERYFLFIALSFPFVAIEGSTTALFRSSGNSILPMIVSLGINLLNIGGNAVLIMGLNMGAAGAAISTLIARAVGAIVMLVLIHNKKRIIYIERLFHYRPDRVAIKRILHIGVPGGIESGMFQFGKLLTQTLISSMGTATIAANAVAITISNFQYTTGTAYSNATVTVVGQCVGANEKQQAKRYSRIMLALNYATLWIIAIVTLLLIKPIISVYDLSSGSAELAQKLIVYHSICAMIVWPVAFMLPSIFRAASDVRFPLIISMLSMWIFRVAGGYVLALETVSVFGLFSFSGFGLGIMGVWIAMTVDWLFRALWFLIRYLSGRWFHAV